jgi:L-ascorbate metabolism protein UlaG (beta-lactamase superfamily)
MEVSYRHLGVATVLLDIAGLTIITDPCLDEADGWKHHGWGAFSRKTRGPDAVPDPFALDAALLSHGHHWDNLDESGRALLADVEPILTTSYSARTLDGGVELTPGDTHVLQGTEGPVTVTAVSAQHGVFPLSLIAGPVIGFVVEGPDGERVYITGDTIYTESIREALRPHEPIDLFLPHLGQATFPYLSGPLRYTMHQDDVKQFLDALRPRFTLPIHNTGWSHFHPVDVEGAAEDRTIVLESSAGTVEL